MDEHAATAPHPDTHAHPGAATYVKVAIVLFALTALEVLAYEIARGAGGPFHALQPAVEPLVVEILVVLSAAKFALVAMFYMHLKQDGRLLSGVFVFPIIIAVALALALLALFSVAFLLVNGH